MKTLMPHQSADAQFLAARPFAGCFNGMGTGKTLTSLEATRLTHADRVVIVGPPISLHMWRDEAAAWLKMPAQILRTGSAKIAADTQILVVSYTIATKRAAELGAWAEHADINVLICDESHALKSVKAKRTKALLGKGGLVNSFDFAWMLTGTPVVRWYDDLVPFLFRAMPQTMKKRLGGLSIPRFQLRYCITQKRQFPGARRPVQMVVGSRNGDELNALLDHVATRRTLKDVWEAMPPITFSRLVQPIKATEALRAAAKMTTREIEAELAAKSESLSTARREMGEAMADASVETIVDRAEAAQGALLVGAWHTSVIDHLVSALAAKGLRVASLDGRTSATKKAHLQHQFNDGELDVLVGQIAAMGVSLNLQQGGSSILVVEEDWSPAVMDQFYARLHRFGQGLPVNVTTLVADHRLAEAIGKINSRKRAAHAATNAA